MITLLGLITAITGLVLRFLPGSSVAALIFGLAKHWRAVILAIAMAAGGLGGFWAGNQWGYGRGHSAGFSVGYKQGGEDVAERIRHDSGRRAAAAREAVKRVGRTPRDYAGKLRLCRTDRNCDPPRSGKRLRKPRGGRAVAANGQLEADTVDPGAQRAPGSLLR